jgi:hypothetical protein
MRDSLSVLRAAAVCAVRTTRLLLGRHLHLRSARVGAVVPIPDSRRFVVFRESTRDDTVVDAPVVLSVWFHLRGIPAGARVRRWLFERGCIVNTMLFAGFDGYSVKLWMVDPATSDYAGLYSWSSVDAAERYGSYITGVLRPLSRTGSVGYEILPATEFEDYLRTGGGQSVSSA